MYSMDSGISLGRKGGPKLEGSSPFFGTNENLIRNGMSGSPSCSFYLGVSEADWRCV